MTASMRSPSGSLILLLIRANFRPTTPCTIRATSSGASKSMCGLIGTSEAINGLSQPKPVKTWIAEMTSRASAVAYWSSIDTDQEVLRSRKFLATILHG